MHLDRFDCHQLLLLQYYLFLVLPQRAHYCPHTAMVDYATHQMTTMRTATICDYAREKHEDSTLKTAKVICLDTLAHSTAATIYHFHSFPAVHNIIPYKNTISIPC